MTRFKNRGCRNPWARAVLAATLALGASPTQPSAAEIERDPLASRGKMHIAIGVPNTVDTLKTFVEAEGPFSPGCGSYGIYVWVYDLEATRLVAPTMAGVQCERGLPPTGYLIPWSSWSVGDVTVKTTVCEVQRASPAGAVFVVGSTAEFTNRGQRTRRLAVYIALRPVGPAGFAVGQLSVDAAGDALLVDGHPALVCNRKPTAAGVVGTDTIGALAAVGQLPSDKTVTSTAGNCSGAVGYNLTLSAGQTVKLGFVCPVLPGRRAVGHAWDGTSSWAQLDLQAPNPDSGGTLQPDPGVAYYRGLQAEQLLIEATVDGKALAGRVQVSLPDPRWTQALAAILGHAALAMNDGAPDVAVVNYNVFNRDGVYVANILQKSGCFRLSEQALDYFLSHPFNGRVNVEADNPGQVLWALGQHWQFSRDRLWLQRIYPAAAKLAAMIGYYRTTPPPHYVKATSLEFGETLPPDTPQDRPVNRRQVLRPGSCDGTHPEYTEAFDIAGLRAAAGLAQASSQPADAQAWTQLAEKLHRQYDSQFRRNLPASYGSYAVLWPCGLYPYQQGPAFEQFRGVGARQPEGWRYFALATAHQGLLTGNRSAGCGTVSQHLAHEQCRGWYAFDEGGRSGSGGWKFYRTTWAPDVAMPHGWAIAELWLLLRDCLLFEDGQRLVLLGGVPADWFTAREGLSVESLATQFGPCAFRYTTTARGATLTLTGAAAPPAGFVLRLPPELGASALGDGQPLTVAPTGDIFIPLGAQRVELTFAHK